jgi:hypothetical protein
LKRDRLVDFVTLASAQEQITNWWRRGYARAQSRPVADRFAREAVATLSVTRVDDEDRLLDEIYTGVEWQRLRLRHDQQLEEWCGIHPAGP